MKAKAKRTLTCVLPVAKNRTGQCIGCGACCRLPNPCHFLKYREDGGSFCSIYPVRPLNCRKYPRTASECLTSATCGFQFEQIPAPERLPLHRRLPAMISSRMLHLISITSWVHMSLIFKQLKKLFY
ncbi:MAG: hypothetical protein M0Z56_02650 [Desulfobacteraceae bacterium]|nr:hypothetical protein [Desulfobacteraceae bacterium]